MLDKDKGNGRVTAPNPQTPPAGPAQALQVTIGGPPEGKAIVGFTLSQQWCKDTANVMKKMPWEDVFQVMPELLAATPIYTDMPAPPADD